MIKSWDEIIAKYNSLSFTSKSTNNLGVWGDIFASAYVLKAQEADVLWQKLITLNVKEEESNAKYFIARIFNSIINFLDIEDAIAYLIRDYRRLELFVKYRLSSQDSIINSILAFYIKYEKYDEAYCFFSLLNQNELSGGLFSDSERVSHLIAVVSAVILRKNDYDLDGTLLVRASKSQLMNFLYEILEVYPNTSIANIAEAFIIIANPRCVSNIENVKKLLKNMLNIEQYEVFFTLLYTFNNMLSEKELVGYLNSLLNKKKGYVLLKEPYEKNFNYTQKKGEWLFDLILMHKELIYLSFAAEERKEALNQCEQKYLNNLIINNEWDYYVLLIYTLLKKSNPVRYSIDYLVQIIDFVSRVVRNSSYGQKNTYTFLNDSNVEVLSEIDSKTCESFIKSMSYVSYLMRDDKYLTSHIENLIYWFNGKSELLLDSEFNKNISIIETKKRIKILLNSIEVVNFDKEKRIDETNRYSHCHIEIATRENIDTIIQLIKDGKNSFVNYYKEAVFLENINCFEDVAIINNIQNCPDSTYGNLNREQLMHYLIFRTKIRKGESIKGFVLVDAFIRLYCTELLMLIGGESTQGALDRFNWLIHELIENEEIQKEVLKFKRDFEILHRFREPVLSVELFQNDQQAINGLYKSKVAKGDNQYLYQVFQTNASYKVKNSTFLVKGNYLDNYNRILNEILIQFKDLLLCQGIDLVHYILGAVCYTNYYKSVFESNPLCPWNTIKAIVGYTAESELPICYYSRGKVTAVELVDNDGTFIRKTNMQVPYYDEEFCDYAVRYVESKIREIAKYSRVSYPQKPSHDLTGPHYYHFPNGNSGYYKRVDGDYSHSLLSVCPNIYQEYNNLVDNYINEYYKVHTKELEELKSVHAPQIKITSKPFWESVKDIFCDNDKHQIFNKLLDLYKFATKTEKKKSGSKFYDLICKYWIVNATKDWEAGLNDILDLFEDKKENYIFQQAILDKDYVLVAFLLARNNTVGFKLTKEEKDVLVDSIVITLEALDRIINGLGLNFTQFLLGEYKTQVWDSSFEYQDVLLKCKNSFYKNVGNYIVYQGDEKSAVVSFYEEGERNKNLFKVIIKLIEQYFYDVNNKGIEILVKEKIDAVFYEFFDKETCFIVTNTIYNAVLVTSNRNKSNKEQPIIKGIKVCYEFVNQDKNIIVSELYNSPRYAVEKAFCNYYNVHSSEINWKEREFDCYTFDVSNASYYDFIQEQSIDSETFICEQNKQVLTRFYQLYDNYFLQLETLFNRTVIYDKNYPFTTSKMMKRVEGFIGKDLYQLPILNAEGEEFLQWIEHIKRGRIIYPNMHVYVILLFYYIINNKLFPNKKDLNLGIMCLLWNHYVEEMGKQDASLVLGWIKDYWMVYCSDTISIESFKKLFNRKVVLQNEYSTNNIYKNGLLDYLNDVCFYKVLRGKLVESGNKELMEKAIRRVCNKLEGLFARNGISFKKMLALVGGKNQYLFLRAIVSLEEIKKEFNRDKVWEVSKFETYALEFNAKTNRFQWVFSLQEYNIDFLRLFVEYVVKATERELRRWIGITIPKTFNSSIETIYKSEFMPSLLSEFFNLDKSNNFIEGTIKQCVSETCNECGLENRGIRIKRTSDGIVVRYKANIDYSLDYGGIDENESITIEAIEKARKVLRINQDRLVIEDETLLNNVENNEAEKEFTIDEIEIIRILLHSRCVISDLEMLEKKNIKAAALIDRINEKSMDIYGDILIDSDVYPPSIIEENKEICLEIIENV